MFERKDPIVLRQSAERCRRLGRGINDEAVQKALISLAEEYEREASSSEPETADEALPA